MAGICLDLDKKLCKYDFLLYKIINIFFTSAKQATATATIIPKVFIFLKNKRMKILWCEASVWCSFYTLTNHILFFILPRFFKYLVDKRYDNNNLNTEVMCWTLAIRKNSIALVNYKCILILHIFYLKKLIAFIVNII